MRMDGMEWNGKEMDGWMHGKVERWKDRKITMKE